MQARAGSKVRVKWTDECEEAFHHLKAALCEVATLHVPNLTDPSTLEPTLLGTRSELFLNRLMRPPVIITLLHFGLGS